ncbi:MAG: precorrin-6A synthase (deacetylating), partial [Planktomarina sp.]
SVFVMLDGNCSFVDLNEPDLHIWWGGFLGMPEQVLHHGPLPDVASEIIAKRSTARAQHGWIMDTYLMRKGDA